MKNSTNMADKLLLLPGDGIGPEVTRQARRVAEIVAPDINIEERSFGGASIDVSGRPLTDDTLEIAKSSNAVLLGAVGGPKWNNVARDKRPEAGLLQLRKELDVFANLRPAICFTALADSSSLKRELVENLDILIVRELTSGVYFGKPRGIEVGSDGTKRGFDNAVYTETEIERVADVAFETSLSRQKKVVSVDKSNVMESGLFWRETVQKRYEQNWSNQDIELTHMYADACAMELVRTPKQFDIILADNLFGDILSDEAAMLTGSIGMLPSAALGLRGKPGLYEPVHGSAPDIAGKGTANPCAAILSLAMAFSSSFQRPDIQEVIFSAVSDALNGNARTPDIGGELTTSQMGDEIVRNLTV